MWRRLKIPGRMPFRALRSKLVFSFLLVVLAGGLASTIIGTRMVANTIISEAQNKVRHDMASAWMVYQEKLSRIKEVLHLTAKRDLIIRSLVGKQVEVLRRVDSPWVEVMEACTAGLDLLELIQGYAKVVLIDSIQIEGKRPGQIFLLGLNDLKTTIRLTSPHDVNLATAMELGRKLGLNLPQEIKIYAIQVEDVSTFDEDCSPAVEKAISRIAEEIVQEEGWSKGLERPIAQA